MVRVRLKGVNTTRVRLASGEVAVYHYAWKGGPRLKGAPGSDEFIESYRAAHDGRRPKTEGTFQSLIDAFLAASEFTEKAPKTQRDYRAYVRLIEKEFGDTPIPALESKGIRGDFKTWRDGFLPNRRKADYAWTVLARILAVALDHGKISVNPCTRGGRLYAADRSDLVWTEDHLTRLYAEASPEVSAVVTVALWTGQRQGDVLRMPWSAYQGGKIRVRQAKGGARVVIPAGGPLRDLIAGLPKHGPVMLTSSDERAWTSDGFRASFRRACERAGIADLHFHDLRGTAVTRLALAGATVPEIAAVTGHSLDDVAGILDRHYLGDKVALAESAILKLERKEAGTISPK